MVCEAEPRAGIVTIPEAFQVALQHHQAGRLAEAEALYRQILAVDPRHADALHLLGVLTHQAGQSDLAVEMIREAIALVQTNPAFHSNLGAVFFEQGRFDEAVAAHRAALKLQPDNSEALVNLGNALNAQDHVEDSIAAYRRALQLKPEDANAHSNLGNALCKQGRLDEATAAYQRAVELAPNFAEAHNNLGNALRSKGRLGEAVALYRRAIRLKPEYAEANSNLGTALRDQGLIEEAIAACRVAIRINPNSAAAHCNLGNALRDAGQSEQAISAYRAALKIQTGLSDARSNLLVALHYLHDVDPRSLFEEHRRWEEIHAKPLAKFIEPHANDCDPRRRIRVGYVSPDFREHSVAFFLEALLACHDPAQVEVFCYSDVSRPDAVTARLRRLVPHWRDIFGMPDAQATGLIRGDRMDILVDLAGHTASNRLPLFARKPAPLQATWLGYPDTTGLKTMDFRLTDALADPPGATEHLHAEALIRLPDCAWCFRPSEHAPPVSATPILHAGQVTFGCFNALPKITPALMRLWCDILLAVPGSRLLLKNIAFRDSSSQQRIRAMFADSGIATERIEMAGHVADLADHLSSYGRVDIALDTFPYHGTTTTCEALWMGVPVVTLAGKTHASRVGVSLLTNVGLPELIASDAAEYVTIAAALAGDPSRLAALRTSLRARMVASPLMDGPRFARNVESAFRTIWGEWCAKQGRAATEAGPG